MIEFMSHFSSNADHSLWITAANHATILTQPTVIIAIIVANANMGIQQDKTWGLVNQQKWAWNRQKQNKSNSNTGVHNRYSTDAVTATGRHCRHASLRSHQFRRSQMENEQSKQQTNMIQVCIIYYFLNDLKANY